MDTETIIDRFLYAGYFVQIFEFSTADDGRQGFGFHAKRGEASFSGGLTTPLREAAKRAILQARGPHDRT